MRFTLLALITFLCLNLNAQIDIGEWREHLPYYSGTSVAVSPTKVFMSTGLAMLEYDKESKEVKKWSKVNGLSDNGVNVVRYSNDYNTLILGYSNANVDLMIGSQVINISDIKRFQIPGDKTINNIIIRNHLAYLSCGFGIVVIDLQKQEIKETYYIGENATYVNVREITFTESRIYAATSEGVYYGSITGTNLADFNNWTIDNGLESAHYETIVSFGGNVYTSMQRDGWGNDSIIYLKDGAWQAFPNGINDDFMDLNASDDHLIVASNNQHKFYLSNDELDYVVYTFGSTNPKPKEIVKDPYGDNYWSADRSSGLVRTKGAWSRDIININGAGFEFAYHLYSSNGVVLASNGSRSDTWNSTWNRKAITKFQNEQWSNKSLNSGAAENDTIWDIVSMSTNPTNPSITYFSSWGRGLVEMTNNEVTNVFRDHNSIIERVQGIGYYDCRIGGIQFDNNGVLWVANSQSIDFIKAKSGNDWYSFNMGTVAGIGELAGELVASGMKSHIYVQLGRGDGLLAFDYGGTLDDTSDDSFRVLKTGIGSGDLPSNEVYAIAEDKDGEIWLGTDKGIAVLYSPDNIFLGSNFDAQQILIEQDGHWQNLLEAEVITDIQVDGANQKWIATQGSGVYLMNENGQEEIHHFTEDNSPLLSNSIQSITINDVTGEVFFGTAKGIISFRGTATEGVDEYGDVYAFPNPVRPGYSGMIGITGLVNNVSVKITDISGNVVFETQAEGGQANWDGNSLNGERASSGVYLVFCSDEEGTETFVTKILLVN